MFAIFNKKSKEFMGFVDITPNKISATENNEVIYKEVGDINPSNFKWIGDCDNGELVQIKNKSNSNWEYVVDEINERQIDELNERFIQKLYSIQTQLYIIIKQIDLMATEKTEDFKKMSRVINECKRINSLYKEAYAKSNKFNYFSYADMKEKREKYLSGGLSEKILKKHEIDLVSGDEDDKDII